VKNAIFKVLKEIKKDLLFFFYHFENSLKKWEESHGFKICSNPFITVSPNPSSVTLAHQATARLLGPIVRERERERETCVVHNVENI
jgi:hypothetical protein